MNARNADRNEGLSYDSLMAEPNDQNLLNFIASTVETLRVRIDSISEQMAGMATGEQMAGMATKVDLANLRDELREEMATMKEVMATKDDLARLESQMATKDDLARLESRMATKDDLARVETTMHDEFERVHIRIDSLDRGMGSRMGLIESDVSRLRSVLYLLVKDNPDMLRLLGQPHPGESRP
jgi:hypothetical protein